MKKTTKLLLVVLLVLIFAVSALLLVACKDNSTKVDGTYYLGANGVIDKNNYYTLKDKQWTADDGSSGEYEITGTSITLYIDVLGTKTEFTSGAVSGVVLVLETAKGNVQYYYKDGKLTDNIPSYTPSEPDDNTKTVSFNLNDGNGTIEPMKFEVGKTMANLPSPTRDGYTFICWTDLFGTEYTAASVMPDSNLSLTAKWEKKITSYKDDYISLSPASDGCKDMLIREMYRDEVDQFAYVELTSDDLGGVDQVGVTNNFTLRTLDGMEYKINKGYSWQWYQGDFSTPNGAQRFTLNYGSNIQFITVSNDSGNVVKTYLLDIYVKYDYYISLYTDLMATEPYDVVRVIENERFSADTPVEKVGNFEFDSRVYFNRKTSQYESFVYTTAITSDWKLYQTFKPYEVSANADDGAADKIIITPYTRYLQLPQANKDGYDFLGWQTADGKYFCDVTGYTGLNYLKADLIPKEGEVLKAVYAPKKFFYTFDNDVFQTESTVPIVTYTDSSQTEILEVLYAEYGGICPMPTNVSQGENKLFKDWLSFKGQLENGSMYIFDNTPITKPVALYPECITVNSAIGSATHYDTVYLNETKTFSNVENNSSFRAYLPTGETYNFKVTTTSSVTFTISNITNYQTPSTATYTATSSKPVEIDIRLKDTLAGGSYMTFTVTDSHGSFTTDLQGSTATSIGDYRNLQINMISFGDEKTIITETKDSSIFLGWYDSGTKLSDYFSYTFTIPSRSITYTANWLSSNFEYEINSYGVTITGVKDNSVKEIVIPDTVTGIGENAFSNCSNLTSITIGKGIKSVGQSAFSQCSMLTRVNYTGTLAEWCNISFGDEGNPLYIAHNLHINNECVTQGKLVIPNTVKEIKNFAFAFCTDITSVEIPESVTSIGLSAFYVGANSLDIYYAGDIEKWLNIDFAESIFGDNYKLFINGNLVTSVVIPDTLTEINAYVFDQCISITSVTIPNSVTTIGSNAFYCCDNLNVYYQGNMSEWCNISLNSTCFCDYNLYINNRLITTLVIPNNVTAIKDYAFHCCISITNITIPDCVTEIGKYAFGSCSILTSITIPSSVTSIGDSAFYGCSSLESIIIPDSVTKIGHKMFYNCSNLTSITIPSSVTSIGISAFGNCSRLSSVTIGSNVTTIGYCAFTNCRSLYNIKFNGTIAQWNTIKKESLWNHLILAKQVICSDGTVAL